MWFWSQSDLGSFKSWLLLSGSDLGQVNFPVSICSSVKGGVVLALGRYGGLGGLARMKQLVQPLLTLQLSLPPAPSAILAVLYPAQDTRIP